jgi:succinate-semialdehyde dehydrogenase/glutarate-semialdehyde dehydrogenase
MEAFDNELFGPAASVMRAKMMLTLLNGKQFAIWIRFWVFTGNIKRGEKLALQLEAGSSFVNKLWFLIQDYLWRN